MYCDLWGSVLVNIFISSESLASISLPAGYFIVSFNVFRIHRHPNNMLVLQVNLDKAVTNVTSDLNRKRHKHKFIR